MRTPEALQRYATVHWARHVGTFTSLGADPEELTRHIMASAAFADDMAGFDVDDIIDVQSMLLDPTSFSPIH